MFFWSEIMKKKINVDLSTPFCQIVAPVSIIVIYTSSHRMHCFELRYRHVQNPVFASRLKELIIEGNMTQLFTEGKFALVLPYSLREVEMAESISGIDHLDVACALHRLTNIYAGLGDFVKARLTAERALKISEICLGPQHKGVAEYLCLLAMVLYMLSDFEAAQSVLERAGTIRETVFGPDHELVADVWFQLGRVFFELGKGKGLTQEFDKRDQLDMARFNLERCIRIQEKHTGKHGPHSIALALSLKILARVTTRQGEFGISKALLTRAVSINDVECLKDERKLATLEELAGVLAEQGEIEEARRMYESILPKLEAHYGPNHPNVGAIRANMAIEQYKQGEYAKAKMFMKRADTIFKTTPLPLKALYENTESMSTALLSHINANKDCSVCGAHGVKLMLCGQCKQKYYCSPKCQARCMFNDNMYRYCINRVLRRYIYMYFYCCSERWLENPQGGMSFVG